MTREPPGDELAQQQARAAELRRTHQGLRERRAEVAELAAAVHEEAARVHEELDGPGLLDPGQLRAHAEADRAIAAQERAALAEELAEDAAAAEPD